MAMTFTMLSYASMTEIRLLHGTIETSTSREFDL